MQLSILSNSGLKFIFKIFNLFLSFTSILPQLKKKKKKLLYVETLQFLYFKDFSFNKV